MNIKAITLAAAALGIIAGCGNKAESTSAAGVDFTVDTLFTKDRCTVYRFKDGGSYRYFTNCSGSTSWIEGCGKNCTKTSGVEGASQ